MKKFKVKTRERLYDRLIRGLSRIIKRKPKFINLNEGMELDGRDLPKQCMLIGNHNGAGGPYSFRTFMKRKRFMIWGAHPMCENYKSRRHYLYHTFYRQKLGWSKPRAKIMSWFFGSFSHIIYAHAGIIPTYTDGRLSRTFKYSFECLEKDVSVFVFPEDSSEGYKEQIEKFWPGFLHFAILYYKRKGEDLPIYTCYYHKKPKTIVIGKPLYVQELLKENSKEEVLEIFRTYMNSLREYAVEDNKK
ncbi:MAG: hypothetical protein FWE13_03430 [Firmicutes bacterium]|nr:hypothetical protein [Bacillota bacterium]